MLIVCLVIQSFVSFIDVTHVFGQQLSITLKWSVDPGTGIGIGPLAADLNNDGLMEIVVTGRPTSGEGRIAVLNSSDGSILWSQPYGGDHVPIEIVDLNRDGNLEIVMCPQYVNGSTSKGVMVLHGNNGSIYWYNKKAAGKGTYIAVADINADGYLEIFSAFPGLVTALTYDGRIFASTYTYYTCVGGLSIGDTDFDGVFEVYLGERSESYPTYPSGGRGIRAFWADNLTEIWCDPEILCSSQAPVLADVDKDGDLEIIILHQRGGIAVYNTDGSVNTYNGTYRRKLYIPQLPSNGHSNPTVADVDDDGNLELIQCGSASGDWYNPAIWDLVNWNLDAILPFKSAEPPGVADIDGDGKLEIVAPNEKNVTIFKYNKVERRYDVMYTIDLPRANPFFIAQDIDADGELELVFKHAGEIRGISVYDVNVPAPKPLPRSGRYFYSEYRTRVPIYVPPPGPQAPKITEISPNDGAMNVPLGLSELSFKLTDYQCDPISFTVTTNPYIGSASGINVSNGKITVPISGLDYSTTYTWTITAVDGTNTNTKAYTFTTMDLLPWYDTNWRYRKAIAIDHTKVAADQTNFPVLIDLTDPDLKTKARPDGADILFTDQNQVKLSHEIEQYDNTTGQLIAWVNVPYLSSTVNTIIYMYYGDPICENQQNPAEVWDANYMLILHLNEKTGTLYDSTANGNNGTSYGDVVQGKAGAIGNCVEFNGGYVELSRVCTSEMQFTFSAWIYPRPGARYFISQWWSYQGAFLHVSGEGNAIEFYINNVIVSKPITLNNWYYVVGTFDGATAKLYINDYSPVFKSASNVTWTSQNMYIGDRSDHKRQFYGFIDEVRVSNIARDAAWIITEYNNQLNPATFYIVCPEESFTYDEILTVLVDEGGRVIKNPDSEKYAYGTSVRLTAEADVGYTFSHWEGDLTGNLNPATILMTGNKTVKAVFVKSEYTLTINVEGGGSVTKEPNQPTYTYGTVVKLTATPEPGYAFSNWTGDLLGNNNPEYITMTGNKVVTAVFVWTQTNWWNPAWKYRRTITIDHTKVSGELTDFPVLIEITNSSLAGKAQSDGDDFVFTDKNNTKLDHQIEFYDNSTGHLIVWVRVPNLSSTVNTVIYMYYGNPNCGNQQNPTAVWDSNYKLVLHLNEKAGIHYDSTINGNNGTPYKGVLQGVTGKIDGADTFDGGNDYVEIPHSDTLAGYTEAFTVSFWIRLEDTSRRQTILCKYDTNGNMRSWQIEYDPLNCPNSPFWFFASKDGITYSQWWASFVPKTGVWYHVTIVWEANSIPKFYINGVQVPTVGTDKILLIFNNVGVPLRIARSVYSTRCFKGSLDEITISNQARSTDWILTTYNNQFDPTTFYSVGVEETFGESTTSENQSTIAVLTTYGYAAVEYACQRKTFHTIYIQSLWCWMAICRCI
jgi:hypothetical protein